MGEDEVIVFLRARPPVRQQREQVEDVDGAGVVEVRRPAGVGELTPN